MTNENVGNIMNKDLYIKRSKYTCKQRGMDPTVIPSFSQDRMSEEEWQKKWFEYKEILSVVRPFINKFLTSMKGTPILVLISDDNGYVLGVDGDETIKGAARQLGIEVGVQFTEQNGTNSVSLALEYGQPIELVGMDHYHHFLHSTACYTVPFRFLDKNRILGTISFMTTIDHANALLLILLSTVVDSIERELLLLRQNRKLNVLKQIMMDTTRNGIIITDNKGIVTEYNLFAKTITGLIKESLEGCTIFSINPLGDYFYDVLVTGLKYEDIEIEWKQEEGNSTVCLFDVFPIYDTDSKVNGAFGQFRDITEFKKAEELLRNSEKLNVVGQLAAGVAHEIRNPLTTIKGFIQYLRPKIDEEKYVEIMLSELDRINFIVSEFLVLAKPQIENFQLKDVLAILQDTVVLFQTQAIMNGVHVDIQFEPPSVWIECDENQIKQVFMNILKNALEAMHYGGQIQVKIIKIDGQRVLIRFIDEGVGISEAEMENLGKPFYTTKETGTGLGLMVSKKIIENHKGTFIINSQINVGTTIDIILNSACHHSEFVDYSLLADNNIMNESY